MGDTLIKQPTAPPQKAPPEQPADIPAPVEPITDELPGSTETPGNG